jgi:hypothetical protein
MPRPIVLTFLTHTLLKTSVTSHAPDLAIDNWESILVEPRPELLPGHSETDRIGNALAERTGRALHTGELDLRVSSRDTVSDGSVVLLDRVERPGLVPREVEHEVLEQTGVSDREDKAVARKPIRVGRVVLHDVSPKTDTNRSGAHDGSRVTSLELGESVPST